MIEYLVAHSWIQHSDNPISVDTDGIEIPDGVRFAEIHSTSELRFRLNVPANEGSRLINGTRIIQLPPGESRLLFFHGSGQVTISWGI